MAGVAAGGGVSAVELGWAELSKGGRLFDQTSKSLRYHRGPINALSIVPATSASQTTCHAS